MMKKIKIYLPLWLVLFAIMGGSCTKSATSYSSLREQEKKQIKAYIEKMGLDIATEQPSTEDYLANPKLYYKVSGYSDLYYRLDVPGDSVVFDGKDSIDATPVRTGDRIIMRYKKFTMTVPADTILDSWTTLNSAYPVEFQYMMESTDACTGWHVAVGQMKYSEAECTVLVPSKLGMQVDGDAVIPYGYKLKMLIKSF